MKKVIKRRSQDNSGIFIPAGLFIGLGIGALYHQWAAGVLIGLGAGFLVMATVKALK